MLYAMDLSEIKVITVYLVLSLWHTFSNLMRSLYTCLVISRYGVIVSSYWQNFPPRQMCLKSRNRNSSRSLSLYRQ